MLQPTGIIQQGSPFTCGPVVVVDEVVALVHEDVLHVQVDVLVVDNVVVVAADVPQVHLLLVVVSPRPHCACTVLTGILTTNLWQVIR